MGEKGLTAAGEPPALSLFDRGYRALVVGSGGAIGSAFAEAFAKDVLCTHVELLSRSDEGGFDFMDPGSIAKRIGTLATTAPFDVVIDATGALTINGAGPEKSLNALQPEALMHAFAVNAIGPALVLKHLAPLLAPGRSIFAKLSARVGSITDNRKGGWYGYRASKAALNMLLQTAAIELQRKNPLLRVVALQPGTVRSPLSAPFAAGVSDPLEPKESVHGMLAALRKLPAKAGAHFVDYRGGEIPW